MRTKQAIKKPKIHKEGRKEFVIHPYKDSWNSKFLEVGNGFPDTFGMQVTFNSTIILKNVTNFYFTYPLFTNAPYDVDPAFGTTATVPHTELSQIYGRYRVLSYKYKLTYISTGLFPTHVIALHSNTLVSASGGNATNLEPYIGNRHVQEDWVGHSYSKESKLKFNGKFNIDQIVGSRDADFDSTYSSQVASVPSNLTYLEIGAYVHDPAGTYLSAGVVVGVVLKFNVLYYENKNLTS